MSNTFSHHHNLPGTRITNRWAFRIAMAGVAAAGVAAAVGWMTPSCADVDDAQPEAAMRTCAVSMSISESMREDDAPLADDDGTALPFRSAALWDAPLPTDARELPDGSLIAPSYYGVNWSEASTDFAYGDSAGAVSAAVVRDTLYAVALRTRGEALVRTASGATLHAVDLDAGADPLRRTQSLALGPGLLATADGAGAVAVWDLATGAERWRTPSGGRAGSLGFSPDGSLLAVAVSTGTPGASSEAHEVRVVDARDGAEVARWVAPSRHLRRPTAFAFAPDNASLAVRGLGRAQRTVVTRQDRPGQRDRVTTSTTGPTVPVTVWRLPPRRGGA